MENKTEKQNIVGLKQGQGTQFSGGVLNFRVSSEIVEKFLSKVQGQEKDEPEKVREKIKLAQIGLRRSRESYVDMELKKSQYWSEVEGFFGKSVSFDPSDPEIQYMREIYQKAVDHYRFSVLNYIYALNYDMTPEQVKEAMINEMESFRLSEAMILFETRTSKMSKIVLDKYGVSSSLATSFASSFSSLKQMVFDSLGVPTQPKKVKAKKTEKTVKLNLFKPAERVKKEKPREHQESYFTIVLEQDQRLDEILINNLRSHEDEIYEHHQELKGQDTRQVVKRMLSDWYYENMDDYPGGPPDLVHQNSVIVIDLATLRIVSIDDPDGLVYASEVIKSEDIKKESFAKDIVPWSRSRIEINEERFDELEHQIKQLNKEMIAKYDKNHNEVLDEDEKIEAKDELAQVSEIEKEKAEIESKIDRLLEPTSLKMTVGTLREAICGGNLNIWKASKNKSFSEVEKNMPIYFRKKLQSEIDKLNLDHRVTREKRGETLEQWTRRIGYLIWEKNGDSK